MRSFLGSQNFCGSFLGSHQSLARQRFWPRAKGWKEFYYDFAILKSIFYLLPENFCGSPAIFSAGRGSPRDRGFVGGLSKKIMGFLTCHKYFWRIPKITKVFWKFFKIRRRLGGGRRPPPQFPCMLQLPEKIFWLRLCPANRYRTAHHWSCLLEIGRWK